MSGVGEGAVRERRSMVEILAEVAREYRVSVAELKGPDRARRLYLPRQDAMARMCAAGKTTTQVGLFMGGRDHTTVCHGVRVHHARTALSLQGDGQ